MPEPDVRTQKIISVLTPELNQQIRRMRMEYALAEMGCLMANDDHGPWGRPDLVPRVPMQRSRIYTGIGDAGTFNHHSQLTKFKGKYYFTFSNGIVDEDEPGQRTMLSASADGCHWSEPSCLVPADASAGLWRSTVALYADETQLVAWAHTKWDKVYSTEPSMSSTSTGEHVNTRAVGALGAVPETKERLDAHVSTDGENWEPREGIAHKVSFFEAPRPTQAGTLLTGGTSASKPVAVRWDAGNPVAAPEVIPIPADESDGVFVYGEATWYQTDDGRIWMYWRDEGCSLRLYLCLSDDDGKSWSPMFMTDFPDSMSRVYAGRLPDGRFYLLGNSFPKLLDRMHLMISISEDGAKFSKMYTLVDDPTAQRVKGTLKVHGHAYPCGLVDGDRLLVAYSVNKEDIECGIVELADL